ncbi:MAG: RNA polymerase sigma factor [bacterium]
MTAAPAHDALETAYRTDARRVLATLTRLLGSLDAAEEALHDAFFAAAEQWPRDGVPANRYAWLVSVGRFKTISRWRRQARLDSALPRIVALSEPAWQPESPELIEDDELRLIFICCHPLLPPDMRVALTLREVGGLTTEEIARAYMVPSPTIGQRIVRAKAKIRDNALPYEIPSRDDLPARLDSALHVIYLIFNEGYAATDGPTLTRADLCTEAIRLGRVMVTLLEEPEALGLLAMMLLHHARCETRVNSSGDLVLLEDQDRSQWDRTQIAEAKGLIEQAFATRRIGSYVLQAAISAVHADAQSVDQTDWPQIVSLYDVLCRADPSPVVALNRAAAVGMRDGPAAGLAAAEAVLEQGGLDDYHPAHVVRADLLRRLGRGEAAQESYRRALVLTRQPAERRFLEARLRQLGASIVE